MIIERMTRTVPSVPALSSMDELAVDTIRTLAIDAVQQASSGHPGTPKAMAPVAYTLWRKFLRFDPEDPDWPNRDRFVLSMGHASMLLYALLHLSGAKDKNPDPERSKDPRWRLRRFPLCGEKFPSAIGGPLGGRASAMQVAESGTGGRLLLASGPSRRTCRVMPNDPRAPDEKPWAETIDRSRQCRQCRHDHADKPIQHTPKGCPDENRL